MCPSSLGVDVEGGEKCNFLHEKNLVIYLIKNQNISYPCFD